MSYNNLKPSLSIYECTLSNKTYKKCRRKRRRNKYKNFTSKLKKKHQKKLCPTNMTDSTSFSKPKKSQPIYSNVPPDGTQIMSNWYWSNYTKALEWRDKNKIAHWKACALALQEENRYLRKIINSMQPGMCPHLPMTMQNLSRKVDLNKINSKLKPSKDSNSETQEFSDVPEEEELNDDEVEFEMSEQMIKFFEQSFKHKMDLKKQKEEKEYEIDVEKELKQRQANKLKRFEEMKLLYGDGASMITGMETAVQLSFDRYCDMKSPKYWPNIPLRL